MVLLSPLLSSDTGHIFPSCLSLSKKVFFFTCQVANLPRSQLGSRDGAKDIYRNTRGRRGEKGQAELPGRRRVSTACPARWAAGHTQGSSPLCVGAKCLLVEHSVVVNTRLPWKWPSTCIFLIVRKTVNA